MLFSDLVITHSDGSTTDLSDTLIQEDSVVDDFQQQFTQEIIQNALEQLDQESQELIHSRYVLQYSYDTLAHMYGLSNDNVRQKLSRIVKKLREELKKFST